MTSAVSHAHRINVGLRRRGAVVRRRLQAVSPGGVSLSVRLVSVTALAVTPLVLFASALALRNAGLSLTPTLTTAWAAAAAVPLAFGVAAILGVSWSVEAMVLRWLSYLERLAHLYTRGRYSSRPLQLRHAPSEFRTLGESVAHMAEAVEQRDRELRASLEEQTMLLREVHHRVKNNLQVVGSLLSLQAARASDPEAEAALVEALVRVDSLSLAQRYIVADDEHQPLSACTVFGDLRDQMRARVRSGRKLALDLDVEDMVLPVQVAAGLLSVATEALLAAYLRPGLDPLRVTLGLSGHSDELRLWVDAPAQPDSFAPAAGGIAREMIDRFARPLKGVVTVCDAAARVEIAFPPLPARTPEAAQA